MEPVFSWRDHLAAKTWPVREWFERVWFCHHNARVLVDMEHRLSCVLMTATGGQMSNAYYSDDAMQPVINDYIQETYEEGYEDGKKEAAEDLAADHDRRVSELLASNNALLERARAAERDLEDYRELSREP